MSTKLKKPLVSSLFLVRASSKKQTSIKQKWVNSICNWHLKINFPIVLSQTFITLNPLITWWNLLKSVLCSVKLLKWITLTLCSQQKRRFSKTLHQARRENIIYIIYSTLLSTLLTDADDYKLIFPFQQHTAFRPLWRCCCQTIKRIIMNFTLL